MLRIEKTSLNLLIIYSQAAEHLLMACSKMQMIICAPKQMATLLMAALGLPIPVEQTI